MSENVETPATGANGDGRDKWTHQRTNERQHTVKCDGSQAAPGEQPALDTRDPNNLTTLTACPDRRRAGIHADRATKYVFADGKFDGVPPFTWWIGAVVDVSTPQKLWRLLKWLEPRHNKIIVPGAIRDDVKNWNGMRRLKMDQAIEGMPGHFHPKTLDDTPRFVWALDLDTVPAPAGFDLRDLSGAAAIARATLPPAFQTAFCICAATSG